MNSISIRRASCGDGPIIANLLHTKYSFSSVDEAEQAFSNECGTHHYRIAEEEGNVVGLLSWRPQGVVSHGVVELTRIAIAQNVSDKWYVKEMLFDQMVAEADYYYKQQGAKLHKVFSMIHSDNNDVKEFFINKGMEQEAVLRNHFRKGTDELVFSLFFA